MQAAAGGPRHQNGRTWAASLGVGRREASPPSWRPPGWAGRAEWGNFAAGSSPSIPHANRQQTESPRFQRPHSRYCRRGRNFLDIHPERLKWKSLSKLPGLPGTVDSASACAADSHESFRGDQRSCLLLLAAERHTELSTAARSSIGRYHRSGPLAGGRTEMTSSKRTVPPRVDYAPLGHVCWRALSPPRRWREEAD